MLKKREANRRHRQIMAAARHEVDTISLITDDSIQANPRHVAVLAYGRYQIRVTAEEVIDALGAALVERGFGLDRIRTTD